MLLDHNLPTKEPDQIAHVVAQSRSVKCVKATVCSTACNHVEFGRFGVCSMLKFQPEDR